MRHKLKIGFMAGLACLLIAGATGHREVVATSPTEVDSIVDLMANAIDHYDSVHATIIGHEYTPEQTYTGEADITASFRPIARARAKVTTSRGEQITVVNNGKEMTELRGDSTYQTTSVIPLDEKAEALPTEQRVRVYKDGRPAFLYRRSLTLAAGGFEQALHPQQQALGYIKREDAVTTVDGNEPFLGRTAVVLSIKPSSVHSQSYDKIRFWVDSETGILLKQEFWKEGALVRDQAMTKLKINMPVDPAQFELTIPEEAEQITPMDS